MASQLGAPIVGLVENMSYVTCPKCEEQIHVFGPSRAMQTAARLNVPLFGQLPLDAELACRCDQGEIEKYEAKSFDPIVQPIVARMRSVQA
jgi:hypothetical protein